MLNTYYNCPYAKSIYSFVDTWYNIFTQTESSKLSSTVSQHNKKLKLLLISIHPDQAKTKTAHAEYLQYLQTWKKLVKDYLSSTLFENDLNTNKDVNYHAVIRLYKKQNYITKSTKLLVKIQQNAIEHQQKLAKMDTEHQQKLAKKDAEIAKLKAMLELKTPTTSTNSLFSPGGC